MVARGRGAVVVVVVLVLLFLLSFSLVLARHYSLSLLYTKATFFSGHVKKNRSLRTGSEPIPRDDFVRH